MHLERVGSLQLAGSSTVRRTMRGRQVPSAAIRGNSAWRSHRRACLLPSSSLFQLFLLGPSKFRCVRCQGRGRMTATAATEEGVGLKLLLSRLFSRPHLTVTRRLMFSQSHRVIRRGPYLQGATRNFTCTACSRAYLTYAYCFCFC